MNTNRLDNPTADDTRPQALQEIQAALAAGDEAVKLHIRERWDDEAGEDRPEPLFDPMYAYHLDREQRVGYAQAQFTRASVLALTQAAGELADLTAAVTSLSNRTRAQTSCNQDDARALRASVREMSNALIRAVGAAAGQTNAHLSTIAETVQASDRRALADRAAAAERLNDPTPPRWIDRPLRWFLRTFCGVTIRYTTEPTTEPNTEPTTVNCPHCTATSQDLPAHMADYHPQENA